MWYFLSWLFMVYLLIIHYFMSCIRIPFAPAHILCSYAIKPTIHIIIFGVNGQYFKNYFKVLYTCLHMHICITTKVKSFILTISMDIYPSCWSSFLPADLGFSLFYLVYCFPSERYNSLSLKSLLAFLAMWVCWRQLLKVFMCLEIPSFWLHFWSNFVWGIVF